MKISMLRFSKDKQAYSLMLKTVIVLLLLILPLNILSLATVNVLLKDAEEVLRQSVNVTLNSYMSIIDGKIKNSNYYLYDFPNHDENCIGLLRQDDDWTYMMHRWQVYHKAYDNLSMTDSADQLFFYLQKKEDLLNIYKNPTIQIADDFVLELISNEENLDGKWHLVEVNENNYLFRSVSWPDYSQGVFINLQEYLTTIQNAVNYESTSVEFEMQAASEKKGYLTVSARSSAVEKLHVNLTIAASEFAHNLTTGKKIIIGAFAIYLCLVPLLYFLFRREVNDPLQVLNNAHRQLEKGNEDYKIETKAISKEFAEAYGSFNQMSQNLKRLRIEKLDRELLAKELQLENLKLQIRPHFLLNTMNFLYALVQNHQEEPAQELILYLARYFRYMFRNDEERKLAMFDSELSLIQEYLKISAIHYPNEFQVSWQIDPVISQMRIPPLLLHNFFENIIQHSLIEGRETHIVFFAEYEDQTVTIQISDDGRGMPEETVELINSPEFLSQKTGQHVGIRNSAKRMKYYYGDRAELSVESQLNFGTTFTLTIPYNLDEEE